MNLDEKAGFTILEAVEYSSLSRSTLYRLINDGKIKIVKVGSRVVIPRAEIDRFLRDSTDTGHIGIRP